MSALCPSDSDAATISRSQRCYSGWSQLL